MLLIQKSILHDAVTDLSLHYLKKAKIVVVKDTERDDIEFITKTLNCLPIANIEHFRKRSWGMPTSWRSAERSWVERPNYWYGNVSIDAC